MHESNILVLQKICRELVGDVHMKELRQELELMQWDVIALSLTRRQDAHRCWSNGEGHYLQYPEAQKRGVGVAFDIHRRWAKRIIDDHVAYIYVRLVGCRARFIAACESCIQNKTIHDPDCSAVALSPTKYLYLGQLMRRRGRNLVIMECGHITSRTHLPIIQSRRIGTFNTSACPCPV